MQARVWERHVLRAVDAKKVTGVLVKSYKWPYTGDAIDVLLETSKLRTRGARRLTMSSWTRVDQFPSRFRKHPKCPRQKAVFGRNPVPRRSSVCDSEV